MEERRRHPRKPVSWPVRLWLGLDVYGLARAVSASARGIRIAASDAVRTSLKVGEPYRIEINGGPNAQVSYVGKVGNMEDGGVGIELQHAVPLDGPTPAGAGASDADTLARRRSEEVLQNIVAGVSAATGEAFFRSLVQHLTRMLDVDYAFVGELNDEAEKVSTIAVYDEGQIVKNFEYPLLPGSEHAGETDDMRELFPFSEVLTDVNAGYVGAPLYDSAQRLLGLLAVTKDTPVENRRRADAILRIFAVRAAAELERVEDQEEVLDFASEILQAEGYAVLMAKRGDEALRLYEQHTGPIHLLVTDVVMPQISGRELAERLSRVRPKLKVLFMSGYTDDEVLKHGAFQPGTALLQKPFVPDALVHKVREMLDAPAGA